ncbi:MAG: hypothetical protein LBP59_11005 [Planctomycetaceae bacterium]|jgi:hypothetical protein|nr:hypothetical protein [Planctomycetaceae bacterium]
MNTFKLIGANHYVSHWDAAGFPDDVLITTGSLVNTVMRLDLMFREKFIIVAFDPAALNIDELFNPPEPPIDGGDTGNVDLSNYYTKTATDAKFYTKTVIDTKLQEIENAIGQAEDLVETLLDSQGVP